VLEFFGGKNRKKKMIDLESDDEELLSKRERKKENRNVDGDEEEEEDDDSDGVDGRARRRGKTVDKYFYKAGQKIINDPVHGHVELERYLLDIIDTPQFQRLRELKQLGTTYFLFPGASHHRYEHCLGVSHLAGDMVRRFKYNQPSLGISEHDVRMIKVAGLCHDLGHGPFSHAFEGWIHRARPDRAEYEHEAMSLAMLEYLIDDNALDYEREEIKLLGDLIHGQPPTSGGLFGDEKRFLFDIVSNSRNSVDVDKFDYLARDCYNLGIKSSYDFSRLMYFSRVINNEVCFHSKEVFNVYEMFHTRYSLWKQVYAHRVGKAIEYMISDAFSLADKHLHISDAIDDPALFVNLTDSILRTIESSRDQELKPARDLVRRIRKRQLYKFADEVLVPDDKWAHISDVTPGEICEYSVDPALRPEHIRIHKLRMNFAMRDSNPVDNVRFFSRWNAAESFTIEKEKVSLLIPQNFSERYLRIFCTEPELAPSVQQAFRSMIDRDFRFSHVSASQAHSLPPSPLRCSNSQPHRMPASLPVSAQLSRKRELALHVRNELGSSSSSPLSSSSSLSSSARLAFSPEPSPHKRQRQ
jgi:deoxynucleoside triphosphate triphosphohydrolase SAMHD1